MLPWRSPWPRNGRKQWAVPMRPAQFALHFINKKPRQPSFWRCLAKAHQALPTNFLQRDDRIESLSISGVPPLAPGRCCHYACLQSWELNILAGRSEREGWRRQRERGMNLRGRMFRLLCSVLSSLKCMCYHSCVVFTTAGGKHRVTEERRGNARHSKMSKIHTSLYSLHTSREEGKTHFNINERQAGSVCLYISFWASLLFLSFFFFFL